MATHFREKFLVLLFIWVSKQWSFLAGWLFLTGTLHYRDHYFLITRRHIGWRNILSHRLISLLLFVSFSSLWHNFLNLKLENASFLKSIYHLYHHIFILQTDLSTSHSLCGFFTIDEIITYIINPTSYISNTNPLSDIYQYHSYNLVYFTSFY